MTIQIQIGGEPDPFGGTVALALGWATGAGAAEVAGADEVTDGTLVVGGGLVVASVGELTVAGGEVVLCPGEELTVRLEIALLTPLPTLEPACRRQAGRAEHYHGKEQASHQQPHTWSFPLAGTLAHRRQCLAFSLARFPFRRVTPNG